MGIYEVGKSRKQRIVFYSVEELFDTGCITVVRYSKGLNMKIRTRRILVMIVVILMVTDLFSEHIKCNLFLPVLLFNKPRFTLGPVHKFPDIFESTTKYFISFRIQLPSTCSGRIRQRIQTLNPLPRVKKIINHQRIRIFSHPMTQQKFMSGLLPNNKAPSTLIRFQTKTKLKI